MKGSGHWSDYANICIKFIELRLTYKRKIFDNEAQFEEFLRELESRGGNFRMSRGNKTIKEGIVQYFRCNRIFSIAKDKALRIVDDINAGTYEAIKDITQPMDPFGKETSTKPYLRTEEACTAFFRKTYLNDGTIEVRYCDYHLHGDERLRLPAAIRNRIYDMSKKKLPLPVIVMVLHSTSHLIHPRILKSTFIFKGECHRFCMPGTALERRIMAVTPREVQLVAQSVQRRLDAAAKRIQNIEKAAEEASARHRIVNGDEQVDGDNRREDHEAAENLVEQGDDQDQQNDCQEQLEQTDEVQEESAGGGESVDITSEGRGEGGELTELELTMLEEYEQNRGVILTDFQSLKREENRKRLCRERVRARIYTLGRAMRNIQFSDFECDLLLRSEQMLQAVVELWNARMESRNRIDPAKHPHKPDEYSDVHRGSSSEASAEQNEASTAPDTSNTASTVESPITEAENSSTSPAKCQTEPDASSPFTSISNKKVVKTRARRVPRSEKHAKEAHIILGTTTPSSHSTPAVTRLGRVIKRKKILDV
ncbi:hypothetical protein DICVIV_11517 [Dictyocaulus viviparus]|uniref:Uncharacterized protein n=1 Tax=Dictyocaulus viviparus TaxID=29172 RepID=A0A0D8XFJ2_DICVI|nr:hypothetical protein DICVIV_11517 [Dictyocaulus viviparus]